jgi:Tol biopolymer transport system component
MGDGSNVDVRRVVPSAEYRMTPERWQQVKAVLTVSLDLAPANRAAYLDRACAGDQPLREELDRLIAHAEAAESFFAEPAAALADLASRSDYLLAGSLLGSYRILSQLGTGGMGEVYRARDTRLERDVAIKILPRLLVTEPERLARFEREARMLAALNHPHIGAIYGLEESGGMPALVLELVEGPTLAERLAEGPLPVNEALTIARQIAEALTVAHQKGIVHRDLKPSNVKIAAGGAVKVLDFGLAKVVSVGSGSNDVSHRSAMTANGTQVGIILGTAAYMSPEQAQGQIVDKRTDIWAFGCVLFEMLVGQAAFARETLTETLAAIATREPDWTLLPSATPPAIRRLLGRCLEKDSARRLGEINEARIELEGLSSAPVRDAWTIPAVGAIIAAVALVAAVTALLYESKAAIPVTSPREYVQLTDFTDSAVAPSLSPDGSMVTFIRGGEAFASLGQIYVKQLPNGDAVQLSNDARNKYGPVFTPDGSRITYTIARDGKWDTWSVPVLTGQPSRFLQNASGLTWIAEHRVLFSAIQGEVGWRMGIVSATDTQADLREVYSPPNENAMAHYSYSSPDHRWVLVVEMNASHAFTQPCRLVPMDGTSDGRQVGPRGTCTSAAWSPDGRWMYFGESIGGSMHLWRQRFPDGAPEQITFGPLEEEGVAVAPDGRSLVTSMGTRRSAIWIHDGTGERALSSEGYATSPRLSRDGTRVLYLVVRDWRLSRHWLPLSADLRSIDLATGRSDSLLPGVPVTDFDLSPDGKEVAFTMRDGNGRSQIGVASIVRTTPPHVIAEGDQVSFLSDGVLVFRSLSEEQVDLVRIREDGSDRQLITSRDVYDKYGVSPDGEWVLVHLPASRAETVELDPSRQHEVNQRLAAPVFAVSVHDGALKRICPKFCLADWSSDGKFFYVKFDWETSPGRVLAIPVPPGKTLPDLPPNGIDVDMLAGGVTLAGAQVIESASLVTGPDPSTFVFAKTDLQRNLFRIPLH